MDTEFLQQLAKHIQAEAERYAAENPNTHQQLAEPYRAAGDRLVDAALHYID